MGRGCQRCKETDNLVNLRFFAAALAVCGLVGHRAIGAPDEAAVQAGALLAAGRPAEAETVARSCGEPRCPLVLGRALFAQGKPREAAATLADAGELGALTPHARVLQGEALLLSGTPAGALQPLRSAAASEGPVSIRATPLLADALLALQDFTGAREAAERAGAFPRNPDDPRAAMAWVGAQALLGEPGRAQDAAAALRAFWLRYPEHPAAETARTPQQPLGVQLPEPSGRELLQRASRLLTAGKPAAAVAQAQAAAGMLSGEDQAEAFLLHARALAADGKRSEAGPSLQQAWAHGNARVAAAGGMLLARDRARRGREKEAIQVAEAVARKFPTASEADESALFTARLLADAGKRKQARARLARVAARHTGPAASLARWTLAWMSYKEHLRDTVERFAEFAASASSDEERAQGLYWQARAGKPDAATALFRRAAELDPLGWYGLLSRERLGEATSQPAPFPPPRDAPSGNPTPQLPAGDAGALALPVYERAGRPDRAVLLAIGLVGDRGPRAPRLLLDAAYPAAFPAQIARASERTGLDPYLVLAVMRRESLFKPDTRSAAGAVGLLQLLPATARRAAVVLRRPPLRDEQLVDPGTAIDLGTWYLSEVVGRFGDPAIALAAYNAGPRAAAPWAIRGAGRPLDEWVEDIPYRETRRYVKVVVGSWSAYRILAGGSAPRLSDTVPAPKTGANF